MNVQGAFKILDTQTNQRRTTYEINVPTSKAKGKLQVFIVEDTRTFILVLLYGSFYSNCKPFCHVENHFFLELLLKNR